MNFALPVSRSVLARIFWPEHPSLFVIIGGAAGLAGDLTSFFSDLVSPVLLLGIFGSVAALSAMLCLQRAMLVDKADDAAVAQVVHCRVCDSMRFGLFASIAFLLLVIVGQGQSATEMMAEKLGLIHEDVQQISRDVGEIGQNVDTINTNVGEIGDVVQSQKIIADPQSAQDFFTNAWIYSYIHRDPAKSLEALDQMYKAHGPNKMDAAELYYTVGRQVLGRTELVERMENYAETQSDATLLVIAGRNAADAQEGERLYARARAIDSGQPFAYWDIMRFSTDARKTGIEPEAQAAMLREQIAGIDEFISRISEHPAAHYFFLPQYQPDHEMVARQTQDSLKATLASYDRMAEQREKIKQMRQP